jgi:hypothetical protein
MAETQQLYVLEFDDLPQEIVRWLRSTEVSSINEQLWARYQLEDEAQKSVPFVTTWLAMGYIAPEDTIKSLIEDFGLKQEISVALAGDIKRLIFDPIKTVMREKLGFVVDKMLEKPRPAVVATPVIKPAPMAKTTVVTPQAPRPAQPAPVQPVQPQPQAIPRARVTIIPRPIMSDIKKAPSASTEKPIAKKKIGPAVVELEKPFGFTEVEPKAPAPHELVEYRDEHPVVE